MQNPTPARWMAASCLLGTIIVSGCTQEGSAPQEGYIRVRVLEVGGAPLPDISAPLPANLGDHEELWKFEAEAIGPGGDVDTAFGGFARVSVEPGAVNRVLMADGTETEWGRNVLFTAGRAEGIAAVSAIFGEAQMWVADLGYFPAPPGVVPACANGQDDDDDVLVDHPTDPGCAYADDHTEEAGTYTTGVSPPVHYRQPTVADVQGHGSQTPYPAVAVQVLTEPNYVVVTRVASSGFYVTDVDDLGGHNHMYAFNFNTPEGMQVCDRVTYLTGTAAEFFGLTELSFPSYSVTYINEDGEVFDEDDCRVPEPFLLDATTIKSPDEMEKLESGLVRVEGFRIASKFGPALAIHPEYGPNFFEEGRSNCDYNEDGTVDYFSELEGNCSEACAADSMCSEWNGYAARGNYKVSSGSTMIQVNTGTALGFDPLHHKGEILPVISGTLRNFSGGDLNWTIETRCGDDLVCHNDPCPTPPEPPEPAEACDVACSPEPVSSTVACVTLRMEYDNDQATY